MSDVLVHYRCTSQTCARSDKFIEPVKDHLHVLPDEGCGLCGCKRLEILDHPTRGHFVIDWRSQKSLRKNKRKNVAAIAKRAIGRGRIRRKHMAAGMLRAGGPHR